MLEERTVKTNNTEIHFVPDGRLNSFCLRAYLLAGSMFETARDNGISHLYEHVVFRNLKRLYGNGFYDLLSGNGITLDGATYKEFMYFNAEGVTGGIDFAIDVMSKLFLPLEISPEEFEAEKDRIYCEINEDDEKNTLSYLHNRRCWGRAFPSAGITGRRSNIERIGLKALDRLRESIVSAGNIFFFVTGNFGPEHEKKLIDAVSRIPINPVPLGRRNIVPADKDFVFGREDIAVKDSDWYHLMFSFGFDCARIPVNVREMLYSVLCDFNDCLLYQELSENDPVTYDFSDSLEQYDNLGCFTVSYETFPLLVSRSAEALVRAVNRLKRGEFDLELNRKKLAVRHALSLDHPDELNWNLAYYGHILGGGAADRSKSALFDSDKLTMAELSEAAKEIFTRRNLVLTLRGDRRRIDKEELNGILSGLG